MNFPFYTWFCTSITFHWNVLYDISFCFIRYKFLICFIYSKQSLSSVSFWDLPKHIWLLWIKIWSIIKENFDSSFCSADSVTCCYHWVATSMTVSSCLMLCFIAFTSREHHLHFWNFCFLKFYIFLSFYSFHLLQ